MDGLLKKGLEKIREEVNRKIDYVMKEMRKNALVSDVEGFEEKIKKEQKERTYLCKFVEDLTRKIDDLAPSLASSKYFDLEIAFILKHLKIQFLERKKSFSEFIAKLCSIGFKLV